MGEKILNTKETLKNRRSLRKNMTEPEKVLWYNLRGRRFQNVKFRRQHGIGKYIVDYYCSDSLLAIEIDGDTHFSDKSVKYDKERTDYISKRGIRVIRFTNEEVLVNLEGVLYKISEMLKIKLPSPCPLPERERGKI